MSKHILSVGDLVFDLIMPVSLPISSNQMMGGRRYEPGGAGNFMIAARNMGAQVSAVGAVGDDPFGTMLLDMLLEKGIDVAMVQAEPHTTTTLVLVFSDAKTNQHVYLGDYGMGDPMAFPSGLHELLHDVDAVYFYGFTFVEPRTAPFAVDMLKAAKKQNLPVYFDVGPLTNALPVEKITDIIREVDVLLTTADELTIVSAGHTGQATYKHLLGMGVSTIIVKQDAAGCSVITADEQQNFPAYPAQLVDTVGAGDCFGGAFVWAHLNGFSLPECAKIANAMGAATVERVGAGRLAPTRDEVQRILNAAAEDIQLS
ncbi:MAG: carbohydrate kinase family protein [Chloroflexota bacterium]